RSSAGERRQSAVVVVSRPGGEVSEPYPARRPPAAVGEQADDLGVVAEADGGQGGPAAAPRPVEQVAAAQEDADAGAEARAPAERRQPGAVAGDVEEGGARGGQLPRDVRKERLQRVQAPGQ